MNEVLGLSKSTDPRLEKLKKLYGYELAQAKQKYPNIVSTDEETLKNLAVLHLGKSIQDAIVEFIDLAGDSPEDMAVIYGALRSATDDVASTMTNDEKDLAELAYGNWRGESKRD